MNRVKQMVREANFSEGAFAFPFSKYYASWETDEVSIFPF